MLVAIPVNHYGKVGRLLLTHEQLPMTTRCSPGNTREAIP